VTVHEHIRCLYRCDRENAHGHLPFERRSISQTATPVGVMTGRSRWSRRCVALARRRAAPGRGIDTNDVRRTVACPRRSQTVALDSHAATTHSRELCGLLVQSRRSPTQTNSGPHRVASPRSRTPSRHSQGRGFGRPSKDGRRAVRRT
jgi:hypothetical protein